MVPVLADHDGKVGAVVGNVDPRLTQETARGLEATGTLDLQTELGRRVYDLVKAGTLSWSIGFVVPDGGRRRRGEVTELTEVDLAEISAVATPANADARTLSIKSLDHDAIAEREGKLVNDTHRKALAFHRQKSRPPIQIASYPC